MKLPGLLFILSTLFITAFSVDGVHNVAQTDVATTRTSQHHVNPNTQGAQSQVVDRRVKLSNTPTNAHDLVNRSSKAATLGYRTGTRVTNLKLQKKSSKIYHGNRVEDPNLYPWMAYIETTYPDPNDSTKTLSSRCAGVLIAPNMVLTSAHCDNNTPKDNWRLMIGTTDRWDDDNPYDTFYGVKEKITHPNYSPGWWNVWAKRSDYDYMILVLHRNSTKTPVTLDKDEVSLFSGRKATIMGWGATTPDGSGPRYLHSAEVELVDMEDCDDNWNKKLTNRMVCAIGSKSNGNIIDAAPGDSGGPLLDKLTGKLIGTVSWGATGDALSLSQPGVYAKIQDQITWIQHKIDIYTSECSKINSAPHCHANPNCKWTLIYRKCYWILWCYTEFICKNK